MKPVKITCEPSTYPNSENDRIEIAVSGGGRLFVKNGNNYTPAQSSYKVSEIGLINFRLHGHAASSTLRDGSITAKHTGNECKDSASFTVGGMRIIGDDITLLRSEEGSLQIEIFPMGIVEWYGLDKYSWPSSEALAIENTDIDLLDVKVEYPNISLRNRIAESDHASYVDAVVLKFSDDLFGTSDKQHTVYLKKKFDRCWASMLNGLSGVIAKQAKPSTYIGDFFSENLRAISADRNDGTDMVAINKYRIDSALGKINKEVDLATEQVYTGLYDVVDPSTLHGQTVNESWDSTWNIILTYKMTGGKLDLRVGNEGVKVKHHLRKWIEGVNEIGWNKEVFESKELSLSGEASADGEFGYGHLKGSIKVDFSFVFDGVEDVETHKRHGAGAFNGASVFFMIECQFGGDQIRAKQLNLQQTADTEASLNTNKQQLD